MNEPKIAVAVPIYNGARYLRSTLNALAKQRFSQFEVLCGDDCSKDSSREIIEEFAVRDPRFRLIPMAQNLGSASRVLNALLPGVRAPYFVYSSQDDLFSEDWLEGMYLRALEVDADAVLPEVEFFREGSAGNTRQLGLDGNVEAVLSGREAVRLSLEWRISGFALWKTALVRSVGFDASGMNADELTTRRLFCGCRTVAFSRGVFFYRQDNPDAVTKRVSVGSFDAPMTHLMVWEFLQEQEFDFAVSDAELVRAVSSLIWYSRRLVARGCPLSLDERAHAERRLRDAQERLNSGSARKRLLKLLGQGGLVVRAKVLAALLPRDVMRAGVRTLARVEDGVALLKR